MSLTREQRVLRSRIAAYACLARNDPHAINAKARAVYRDSFRNGHSCRLCPEFVMPAGLAEAEVERRADALRRSHFGRLALASSRRRAKRTAPAIVSPGAVTSEGHIHDRPTSRE